jgi:Zn-finger in ubiquitin-hydrolases and other protein
MSEDVGWQVAEVPGRSAQGECDHLGEARAVAVGPEPGCEDCLRIGSHWVHLRQCLTCGRVGCCDSSPKQHANAHAHAAPGHDLARSVEPGESWGWCYADELFLEPRPADR